MAIRKLRLADEIRDLLGGQFLGDNLRDPRLQGISITHVRLSPDLLLASVYFRVFDKTHLSETTMGLKSCTGYLKSILADHLRMRKVPDLRFFYDESVERGAAIEGLLQKLHQDDES